MIGVVDDFVDSGLEFLVAIFPGDVDAGDLEGVEEEARRGVDVVRGEAVDDGGERLLDGSAVFWYGHSEGAAGGFAAGALRAGDGFAVGVVLVAEVLVAEGGALAAVSTGADVAALEAVFGFGLGVEFGIEMASEEGVHVDDPFGFVDR